jgi:hypothetical protein
MFQLINFLRTSKGSREALKTAAMRPLSHCDRAFIATRKRLYRIAIKPQSQRRKASIANRKGKNTEKEPIRRLSSHVSGAFPSLN